MEEKMKRELFALWLQAYKHGLTGKVYNFQRDKQFLDDGILQESYEAIIALFNIKEDTNMQVMESISEFKSMVATA